MALTLVIAFKDREPELITVEECQRLYPDNKLVGIQTPDGLPSPVVYLGPKATPGAPERAPASEQDTIDLLLALSCARAFLSYGHFKNRAQLEAQDPIGIAVLLGMLPDHIGSCMQAIGEHLESEFKCSSQQVIQLMGAGFETAHSQICKDQGCKDRLHKFIHKGEGQA